MVVVTAIVIWCAFIGTTTYLIREVKHYKELSNKVHQSNVNLMDDIKYWQYRYYDIPAIHRPHDDSIFERLSRKEDTYGQAWYNEFWH